jgi:hypothetical protein
VGPKKSAGALADAGTLSTRCGEARAARYQPGCSANCQRQPLSIASNAFT